MGTDTQYKWTPRKFGDGVSEGDGGLVNVVLESPPTVRSHKQVRGPVQYTSVRPLVDKVPLWTTGVTPRTLRLPPEGTTETIHTLTEPLGV